MIIDSGFPRELWAYALKFAVDVYNKTPKKALSGRIPYSEFLQRPCTVKYFRRFGCLSFVLNTFQRLEKFEKRTIKGFLVSCGEDSYNVIDPESIKVYRSKNVDFIENITFGDVYNNKINKTVVYNEGTRYELML